MSGRALKISGGVGAADVTAARAGREDDADYQTNFLFRSGPAGRGGRASLIRRTRLVDKYYMYRGIRGHNIIYHHDIYTRTHTHIYIMVYYPRRRIVRVRTRLPDLLVPPKHGHTHASDRGRVFRLAAAAFGGVRRRSARGDRARPLLNGF